MKDVDNLIKAYGIIKVYLDQGIIIVMDNVTEIKQQIKQTIEKQGSEIRQYIVWDLLNSLSITDKGKRFITEQVFNIEKLLELSKTT